MNCRNMDALSDEVLHIGDSINLGEHKKRMVSFVSHIFYLLVEFHMHYALSTCANVWHYTVRSKSISIIFLTNVFNNVPISFQISDR